MFLNNLYTIDNWEASDESINAVIVIDPEYVLFEGHFPNAPVTPGVVQLQIVKELLERHLDKKLKMKTMRTCKFLQILNPHETASVLIDIKIKVGETFEVTASGSHEQNVYFKAQISYI